MAKKKPLLIPFKENGDLARKAKKNSDKFKWVENFKFVDRMEFVEIKSTDKSKHVVLRSLTTGRIYCMFMKELQEVLLKKIISYGMIQGEFTFVKKGEHYGIKAVL